jgi:hypothetical protein
MTAKSILDHVRVASPCTARWEDMTGDERTRFCQQCSKHVFNLSALSRAEAEALIREKEGKFCGRFHQRRDGRMLTADCSVGRRQRRTRLLKVTLALLALVGTLSTALATTAGRRSDRPRGPLEQKIDEWIYEVKLKLGIVQPPMIMGEIAIIPAPPAPPATTNTVQ